MDYLSVYVSSTEQSSVLKIARQHREGVDTHLPYICFSPTPACALHAVHNYVIYEYIRCAELCIVLRGRRFHSPQMMFLANTIKVVIEIVISCRHKSSRQDTRRSMYEPIRQVYPSYFKSIVGPHWPYFQPALISLYIINNELLRSLCVDNKIVWRSAHFAFMEVILIRQSDPNSSQTIPTQIFPSPNSYCQGWGNELSILLVLIIQVQIFISR